MEILYRHIQKIHSISKEAQIALGQICKELTIKKNENIQSIGHTCKTIYFVNQGCLRIYYFKEDIDITESFEFENDFVARAESLFTGKPSLKGIQAIEDSFVIAIDSEKLFSLFDLHPDLERLFRKIIENSYVNTVNRIESLQFNTADQRYIHLLKGHKDILQRIPLKYIASYLGITPVSLSRIRAIK
jgi:CRP-like cAMP-binding protein